MHYKQKKSRFGSRTAHLVFERLEERLAMDAIGLGDASAASELETVQATQAPIVMASFKPLPAMMAINTTSLDLALQAGMQHLQNILDADNNDLPFFAVWAMTKVQAQYYGDTAANRPIPAHMAFERHLTSNVAGRALYALLQAADVSGMEINEEVYESLKSTVLLSLHKPRNGNWSDTDPSNQMVTGTASDPRSYGSTQFDLTLLYNMGAGMRGAVGLATLGDDPEQILDGYAHSATDLMSIAVYNLRKYYVYGGGTIGGSRVYNWENYRAALGLQGGDRFSGSVNDDIVPNWSNIWQGWSDPFLVYALVNHYESTGFQPSLDLALELRDNAFYSKFPLNPAAVPFNSFKHTFEVVGAMNAYARLALVTNDADMMERVKVRYEALRGNGFNATGWSPENYGINSDVGEANCTAEIIEIALTFAEWGWTEYYDDVERFARGQLLPSQLLDTSFIVPNTNPQNDGQRDIQTRMYGAFGFPAPYGPVSTKNPSATGGYHVDITAGAVSTLAEIKRASYEFVAGEHRINLLFAIENENIQFVSPYEGNGFAEITPQVAGDIRLRLPAWVDRNQISQSLASQNIQFQLLSDHVLIESPTVGEAIQIAMPLITEWQTETINGRQITIRWQGDAVTSMSRMGTPMAFFPDFTAYQNGATTGDFDQDGDIDGRDFLFWQRSYGGSDPAADGNLDGTVNALDLEIWQDNYETQLAVFTAESEQYPMEVDSVISQEPSVVLEQLYGLPIAPETNRISESLELSHESQLEEVLLSHSESTKDSIIEKQIAYSNTYREVGVDSKILHSIVWNTASQELSDLALELLNNLVDERGQ